MKSGFLPYLLYYSCARCLYSALRNRVRQRPHVGPPCDHSPWPGLIFLLGCLLLFVLWGVARL